MALTNDRGIVTRGMLKAFWDRFKNLYASAAHSHGNITSGGTVTASGVAIANNDTLLIVDNSDSSKIKKTSITFDGSTDGQFLSKKGTWETPAQSNPGNGMLKFEFNDTGLAGDVFSANQTGDTIVSMAGGPIHYGEGGDKTTPDGFQYYSPGTIRFNEFPVMIEGGSDMVLIGNVSGGTDGSFTVKTNKETKTISVGKPATAGTADKAVADGDGNTIASTYVKTVDNNNHSHGNITSGGSITASGVNIATGDTLVIVDADDSSKIKKTTLKFDGATTTSFLSQKGTWATPVDNKVYQVKTNNATAGNRFKLLLTKNYVGSADKEELGGAITDKATDNAYYSDLIEVQPGLGRLYAKKIRAVGIQKRITTNGSANDAIPEHNVGNDNGLCLYDRFCVDAGMDGLPTTGVTYVIDSFLQVVNTTSLQCTQVAWPRKTGSESDIYIRCGSATVANSVETWTWDAWKQISTEGHTHSNYVTTSDSRLTDARTPTAHNQASNTITAMTGYAKASSAAAISTSDSLNAAIGKLEKALDGKGSGTVTQVKVGDTAYNPTSGVVSLPAYPSVPGVVSTSANGLAPKVTDTSKFLKGDGTWATPTDTKNTAGSTDSSSKLFLIGATSQAANPQTYSHDTAYVGTDGCLYSNSTKVSVDGHTHSGYAVSQAIAVNADLNSITTPGFYNAPGSNSIQNTPKAGQAFGLWVTKNAGGTYYSQYYEGYQGSRYVRQNQNGTWGAWAEIKYTDTVTTVTNNLTSTSTTDALSAAQGKALNDKFGSYLPLSGGTMTGQIVTAESVSGALKGIKLANGGYLTSLGTNTLLLGTNSLRFSDNPTWNYDVWAGLKYANTSKTISLGIADNNVFTANTAQSGGKITTPGCDTFTMGNSAAGTGFNMKYNSTDKCIDFTFN